MRVMVPPVYEVGYSSKELIDVVDRVESIVISFGHLPLWRAGYQFVCWP